MSRSGLIDKALKLYRHHLDNTHGGSLTRQVDKRLCNSRYKRRPPGSHHWSEDIAAEFLQRQGLVLLVTNYRNRTGEIDLIMSADQTLVFVEVKQRRDSQLADPRNLSTLLNRRNSGAPQPAIYSATIDCNPGPVVLMWLRSRAVHMHRFAAGFRTLSIKPYEETYIPLKYANVPSTVRRS